MSDSDPSFVDPGYTEPEVASGPDERERESAHTDETRYERELQAEESARHAAAERLKADTRPSPTPPDPASGENSTSGSPAENGKADH